MNSKRIFSLLLTLMMVFAVLTGCGNAKDKIIEQIAAEQTQTEVPDETSAVEETTTEEATETETEKTEADVEETVAEETEEKKSEETTEDTDKAQEEDAGDVETVSADTKENAAELGVWVATLANGKDMELGNIRYRVTRISDDQDAIMAKIDEYNADDDNFIKVETDLPENTSLKLCEYEVVYEDGFPGYGEDGNILYSPYLRFSITAEEGGLDTDDGYSHIGINTVDISKKVEDFKNGDTFKGLVVYAIPNNAIEQYYLSVYYSDEDQDGNALSQYTYVKPEEIQVN